MKVASKIHTSAQGSSSSCLFGIFGNFVKLKYLSRCIYVYEIWGSHSGNDDSIIVLGCDARLRVETVHFSEMMVSICESTWHYSVEE
jgi:hypothetical protein